MFSRLLKIRYITVVIVVVSVTHALAFLTMGTLTAVRAYRHVFASLREGGEAVPGVEILHSLDFLFVSMVLIVLSLGIAKLFLLEPNAEQTLKLPVWLRIEKITELKVLLWETILTTLVIVALSELSASLFERPDWTILLIPGAILALSLSLFFMKK
jgi:uncharacterized membrane protein YqhA